MCVDDQNKYEFSLSDEEFDAYHLAYEWSSEIIIIEIIHRLIVVVFETICLCRRRNHNSRPGGATPGKMILGLRVVSCSQINELPNGTVQILPAEDIGVWRSLLRALIKNVSSVFFLPSSLTVFISNHNRAAYDFAAKSIVVEEIRIANTNNVHQRVN
ncbi:protein FAM8A1-like protein [Leptotrombidium deliense]|uniref:Protein FAM8A1-like protein n=1 Tax=Leptotrombidium deliense TaxID=299467 RepID=A0A443SH23_9ACAR|nr:protein FAM8A1-like protein [Leptotrombidium deliense]